MSKMTKFGVLRVRNEDSSPLVLNAMKESEKEKLTLTARAPKKKDRSLTEQAADALHTDEEGWPCMTRDMILAMLFNAGLGFQYRGRENVSSKGTGGSKVESKLNNFMRIFGDNIRLYDPVTGGPAQWQAKVDVVTQSSGSGGAPSVRPYLYSRAAWILFKFDPQEATAELIIGLFDKAGTGVGVGSKRKFCCGRFEIIESKLFDDEASLMRFIEEQIAKKAAPPASVSRSSVSRSQPQDDSAPKTRTVQMR